MNDLSRRKLIKTGLAAAAGVSGLGVAARMAQKYGLVPPDHGGIYGVLTGHFRKNLLPDKTDLSWPAFSTTIASHLRFQRPSEAEAWSYNVLQRLTYLFVIFVLFPLVIWTGLAMSPAFVSAVPATVTLLGGQQSARTIHFFVSLALLLFLLVHVVMVCLAGFRSRMRAMITGRAGTDTERT